jgi:hypothetical protein
MPSLLRLVDSYWPCSRVDLEQANPLTTFPPDLADAQPLDEFGFILPEPTPVPHYDPLTHRAVEVRPIEGQDGVWRQAWEVEALPPPPPAPDWDGFEQLVQQQALIGQAMAAARENQDAAMDAAGVPQGEPSASALPIALVDARNGDLRRLRACWPAVAVRGGVTEEQAVGLAMAAKALNMPTELAVLLADSFRR